MIFKFKTKKFLFSAKIEKIINKVSDFTDLTPCDQADPDNIYTDALNYAMNNRKIKNIAITGPYGSGKSSVIKTFENNTYFKILSISLASFKDSAGNCIADEQQNILIERSILQQLLYGANAQKLPYSRFKRITTPKFALLKSIIFVFWILVVVFIYLNRSTILNLDNLRSINFQIITLFAFALSIPVVLTADLYRASFRISLKKISLSNAEIETGDIPEKSILNRHIDEIIYFFQTTNYNAVVFEDLDRFGSPEVFVKLREINKLINDSDRTNGNIKFLYALKDDMFVHKNRSKFFDFIIPIIPIIDSYNSLDKMQDRLKAQDLIDEIDNQFLREVSLYLDDLRLIHNVFNEFIVYNTKLKSSSLNKTKLLALIIYKNVYPNDFELLHNGKGALFVICNHKNKIITTLKTKINLNISDLKDQIEKAKSELKSNKEELIKSIIGHLILTTNLKNIHGMQIEGYNYEFSQLFDPSVYEKLSNVKNVTLIYDSNYANQLKSLGKTFEQLFSEISPDQNFNERLNNLDNQKRRTELEQKIRQLETQKVELKIKPLYLLLQQNEINIDALIAEYKITDSRLFIYLISNGYIDENYHMFTSNFHEGRLTRNDRDYLITIRDFKVPDATYEINTPEEVCKNMREEDFAQKYVLNVFLIDYLISVYELESKRLESAINFVSSNFFEVQDFFDSYWNLGKSISTFTKLISEQWTEYATESIKTLNASNHIALILTYVSSNLILTNMNKNKELTNYISEFGAQIFASDFYCLKNLEIFINLEIKFHELSTIESLESHFEFALKHNLYRINQNNILLLQHKLCNLNDSVKASIANYSTLAKMECVLVKKYIDNNISEYIDNVFLLLPQNTEEDEKAIISLLNNTNLDSDRKKIILESQNIIFNDFNDIPEEFWNQIIENEMIIISWDNLARYFEIESSNKNILKLKVNKIKWLNALINSTLNINDSNSANRRVLINYLLQIESIQDESYRLLARKIPFEWPDFIVESESKRKILVQEKVVLLNSSSFESAKENVFLQIELIINNKTEYFENINRYLISDDVKELLLKENLSLIQKLELCRSISITEIEENLKLAKQVIGLLVLDNVDCSVIDKRIIIALFQNVSNSSEIVKLFIKCVNLLKKDEICSVINFLPNPYNEVISNGKRPRFTNNKLNKEFAKVLNNRKVISSYKEEINYIQINAFRQSN